ncbi:MAG: DUF1385 domain-containing protein [Nanoarchaeota archaeon]
MKQKSQPSIGGQAVIEGVMMRSPKFTATAVRKKDGKIVFKTEKSNSLIKKYKVLQLPFIRGTISLFEMMVLGVKTLAWSASQQEEGEEITFSELFWTVVTAFAFTIIAFVLLPYMITSFFVQQATLTFNLIDGVIRLALFLGYVWAISYFHEIHRIFQYHGAEHKTVHCYENGKKLTVENVKKFTTLHPRCGTSMIIFVIALSIVLFSFIKSDYWPINVLLRIILIPVIGGIAYEVTKLSAKYQDNIVLKAIIYPGLCTQKLTTKEPDELQIEVAIAAMKKVV